MLIWLAYTMCWPVFLVSVLSKLDNYSDDVSLQQVLVDFVVLAKELNFELPEETVLNAYPVLTMANLAELGSIANNFLIECVPKVNGVDTGITVSEGLPDRQP
jgi:hypothetical protein